MIKFSFLAVGLGIGLTMCVAAQAGQDSANIADLLRKADKMRMPLEEGRVRANLTVEKDGVRSQALPFDVAFSSDRERRVETLGGARKGQRVLLTDEGYWLWMQGIKEPVQLTRLQRMLGQASFGDIGNLRFSEDYEIVETFEKDEAICVKLHAFDARKTVENAQICLNPDTGAPLTADFFYPSGKSFKKLEFSAPEDTPFGPMVRTTVFLDPAGGSTRTEMVYDIPLRTQFSDSFFDPAKLQQ